MFMSLIIKNQIEVNTKVCQTYPMQNVQLIPFFCLFSLLHSTNLNQMHIAGSKGRTLSWWCFNPGFAMEEFSQLGVRSIILTSGTLAPLDSFALELKLYDLTFFSVY